VSAPFRLVEGLSLESPEAAHLALVREFAKPFGYAEEREGALVHDVRPVRGQESAQSSLGRAAFLPHSDVAFLAPPYRPEYLSLFSIENEALTPTLIWPLEAILSHLKNWMIGALASPMFEQTPPLTFQKTMGATPLTGHRILVRDEAGQWTIAFSSQGTRARAGDAASMVALAALESAIDAVEPVRVVVAPGSVLILENLRCLHGREEIKGRRWLQRVYSRQDLAALEALGPQPFPAAAAARAV
jgi:hypothetical protein